MEEEKEETSRLKSVWDMFSITEKEARDIQKQVEHAKIDATDLMDLAKLLKLKGKDHYKAFTFAEICVKNQLKHEGRIFSPGENEC